MNEEHQLGPTSDGSVMVDIGGIMGALVIMTPSGMVGEEIEISSAGSGPQRVHVAVRERLSRNRPARYGAVFPSIPSGDYVIWRVKGGDEPAGTVTIAPAAVTQLDWPG